MANEPKRSDSLAQRKLRNPKAFAINAPRSAERRARRKQDIQERRFHLPLPDRTPLEPPPVVVALVGPPKVGKSTLVKSLVKYFTRHTLSHSAGPITVVSGKKRRLTFVECNNDIHCMIDVAKVADLVLLMVDASFGFEMELFEFLNICQSQGFPKIMAILTHLDQVKSLTDQKKVKKDMKKRFWTEIYKGAKLFFVYGVQPNEIYNKRDTQKIAQQITVMKFRPLTWQVNHPYVLVDRLEDLTDREQVRRYADCDRRVSMYGFVRGTQLIPNSDVHIPGCGDFNLKNISTIPDPCPLPVKGGDKLKGGRLGEKERLIYAPFCGVGGVLYDKDAVYIEVAGSHSFSDRVATHESDQIVSKMLQSTDLTIDEKMRRSEFRFFKDEMPNNNNEKFVFDDDDDDEEYEDADEDALSVDEDYLDNYTKAKVPKPMLAKHFEAHSNNSTKAKTPKPMLPQHFEASDDEDLDQLNDEELAELAESDSADEDPDDPENPEDEFRWKRNLDEKAEMRFFRHQVDIQRLVYNNAKNIFAGLTHDLTDNPENAIERTIEPRTIASLDELENRYDHDAREALRDKFVTGEWDKEKDAFHLVKDDDYGDDDDAGEDGDDPDADDDDDDDNEEVAGDDEDDKARMLKKMRKKNEFDLNYDQTAEPAAAVEERTFYDTQKEKLQQQVDKNRTLLASMDEERRLQVEGFRAGLYVRLEFDKIPAKLVENFDPNYPLIVGGLNAGEVGDGYVRVRLKKHRWFKRILKTRDPLIISMGWRRFQTAPVYHVVDDNERNRALKYTPWHLHCMATFWAPLAPQGTGLVALQQSDQFTTDFRIAATGVVLELDKSSDIVKKLKLVGSPFQVYTKTANIKGMFNSSLEVAKFENTPIRTVSGIRGLIKKAISSPEGAFRATFEDKILMSDIVFLRTWYHVDIPRFCLTIKTLLMPKEEREKWRGARTSGQIRFEEGIKSKNSTNPDSIYKPMARKQFNFRPFTVPKQLQKELPYKDKPKFLPKQEDKIKRVSAIKTDDEKRRLEALVMMGSLQKERLLKMTEKKLINKEKRRPLPPTKRRKIS